MKVLVTGAAGFIGAALAQRLVARGDDVVGVDNLNDYYDVALKQARVDRTLALASQAPGRYTFERLDLTHQPQLDALFEAHAFEGVLHLAAQVGVRYSIQEPHAYIHSNVTSFLNILEGCRAHPPRHLVYASSSSVYGRNTHAPFSVQGSADHPMSLYAATKRSNELMAHAYSDLFGLPTTGVRFFTVYGPWGRPDMAMFLFTRKILRGEPIDVFGYGKQCRDFTYVEDIVDGLVHILDRPATPDPDWSGDAPKLHTSRAPWRLYNIGCQQEVELMTYIKLIEEHTGHKARMNLLPMQPGDMPSTLADVSELIEDFDYRPRTPVEEGVRQFVLWFRDYYNC